MKNDQLYPKATKEISEKRSALAPEITEAFHNFSKAVFKEGALSEVLIALDYMSKNKLGNDPFVYKRTQYVDLLINSEEIFGITK
jgi:hypothetical protein